MGYSVYWNFSQNRWSGYGVPAECDYPECNIPINRGMGYRCEEHYGSTEDGTEDMFENGCELFFCEEHLHDTDNHNGIEPKGERAEWLRHVLSDDSWEEWREENPKEVSQYQTLLED